MASEGSGRVDLGDVVEATARALDRAGATRATRPPFNVTVGIIWSPGMPTADEGNVLEGGKVIPPEFFRAWARSAGQLHNKLVQEMVDKGLPRRERTQMHLETLQRLKVITEGEAAGITKMLEIVRSEGSTSEVASKTRRIYETSFDDEQASAVAQMIAGVISASSEHVNDTAGKGGTQVQRMAKGVASADGEGAVEGAGFGGLIGAEVGAGAGGIGALPGAGLGALLGGLVGGGLMSVGAWLDS
ncbi:hypothetical protein ACF068_07825 [Streptomyces sp. NPDC016309]|uniref:hypothetical protein n=1 Tax=Streptomyces sp. NPDC016309 TaxID=3364965 RepID=UPI0036F8E7EE